MGSSVMRVAVGIGIVVVIAVVVFLGPWNRPTTCFEPENVYGACVDAQGRHWAPALGTALATPDPS